MQHARPSMFRRLAHRAVVLLGSSALTFVFFLALPAIQVLAAEPEPEMIVVPPGDFVQDDIPEFEEPEEQEPDEPDEPEDELEQELPPLDLDTLALALEPGGFGSGWGAGAIDLNLESLTAKGDDMADLFSGASVDQKARPVDQPMPSLPAKLQRRVPATVVLLFEVDAKGGVGQVKVVRSTDSAFDRLATNAVRRWKFEPARAKGEPVSSRLRIPITFQKQ